MGAKRSGFEERMGEVLEPAGFEYEPTKVYYEMRFGYTPDFVLGDVMVECKGWFRPGDTKKYKAIKDSLLFSELVFLLMAPNKKVRKGAKLTMGGWCEKEGIKWFDCPHELIKYANEE